MMDPSQPEDRLGQPVEALAGIATKRAALLKNLRITAIRDLLYHFPREYQDRTQIQPIAEAKEGDWVTVEGEVLRTRVIRLPRRQSIAEIAVRDGTGEIKATWFGRGFLAQTFKPGTRVLLTGKVGTYKGLALKNPEYELLKGDDEDQLNTGRIVPIYPLTEQISQRMLRRWVATALDDAVDGLEESLPEDLLEQNEFPGIRSAMRAIHFPENLDQPGPARARFAYEELLAIQVAVLAGRARRKSESGYAHTVDGPALQAFQSSLPFELTAAQDRAIRAVLDDMQSSRPMVRLIQGDVGSGKTVVALHAIAAAADGGYQVALMAPTEILAEQHYLSLASGLEALGLSIELLTGSTKGAAKTRERIAAGSVQVIVGTHALIQQKTRFQRLGLAIVDEQHRFGVLQRSALADKGLNPDLLHMTATPIPRTLLMTLYGAMDITVIDEMPPGRLPIVTRAVTPSKVPGLYKHIIEQAQHARQTYLICPLVEESEKVDLRSVITHYEELSTGPLSCLRSALLHGKLPPDEKDRIMGLFKAGEIDVLFSTTVIEVGIDVPAATTMVIEDAWRFGLTQLHQLRGRIGRSDVQSHCFLLGKPKTEDGKARLKILCESTSGFDIAEADLELRGPGEFYGLRQAGLSDLRAADLVRDVRLLEQARIDAETILKGDAGLEKPQHHALRRMSQQFKELPT